EHPEHPDNPDNPEPPDNPDQPGPTRPSISPYSTKKAWGDGFMFRNNLQTRNKSLPLQLALA
ncbi:MAG: hypothetical protein Q4E44_10295, partial [bacterium]|nr:hypothetical protein [bacterium]